MKKNKVSLPKTERNKRIVEAHRSGESFRAIAEKEGISPRRAYVIWLEWKDRV